MFDKSIKRIISLVVAFSMIIFATGCSKNNEVETESSTDKSITSFEDESSTKEVETESETNDEEIDTDSEDESGFVDEPSTSHGEKSEEEGTEETAEQQSDEMDLDNGDEATTGAPPTEDISATEDSYASSTFEKKANPGTNENNAVKVECFQPDIDSIIFSDRYMQVEDLAEDGLDYEITLELKRTAESINSAFYDIIPSSSHYQIMAKHYAEIVEEQWDDVFCFHGTIAYDIITDLQTGNQVIYSGIEKIRVNRSTAALGAGGRTLFRDPETNKLVGCYNSTDEADAAREEYYMAKDLLTGAVIPEGNALIFNNRVISGAHWFVDTDGVLWVPIEEILSRRGRGNTVNDCDGYIFVGNYEEYIQVPEYEAGKEFELEFSNRAQRYDDNIETVKGFIEVDGTRYADSRVFEEVFGYSFYTSDNICYVVSDSLEGGLDIANRFFVYYPENRKWEEYDFNKRNGELEIIPDDSWH